MKRCSYPDKVQRLGEIGYRQAYWGHSMVNSFQIEGSWGSMVDVNVWSQLQYDHGTAEGGVAVGGVAGVVVVDWVAAVVDTAVAVADDVAVTEGVVPV